MQESQRGVLELQEDDPDAVELMMHYCYNLDYTLSTATNPICSHASVCVVADKYDVPDLDKIAAQKFKHELKANAESKSLLQDLQLVQKPK